LRLVGIGVLSSNSFIVANYKPYLAIFKG